MMDKGELKWPKNNSNNGNDEGQTIYKEPTRQEQFKEQKILRRIWDAQRLPYEDKLVAPRICRNQFGPLCEEQRTQEVLT